MFFMLIGRDDSPEAVNIDQTMSSLRHQRSTMQIEFCFFLCFQREEIRSSFSVNIIVMRNFCGLELPAMFFSSGSERSFIRAA